MSNEQGTNVFLVQHGRVGSDLTASRGSLPCSPVRLVNDTSVYLKSINVPQFLSQRPGSLFVNFTESLLGSLPPLMPSSVHTTLSPGDTKI